MRALVIAVVVAGCSSHGSSSDLSSPSKAARCEVDAIHAKDTTALVACFHPMVRDQAGRELARAIERKPGTWAELATKAAKLETVTDADFHTKPMPDERKDYGDEIASFGLGHDRFDVVHASDGHWYVIDSGI